MGAIQKIVGEQKYVVPKLYPKQLQFCQSKAKFNGYGGARGGGKSFVIRPKAITLALKYDGISILIVRRTFKELEGNHLDEFRRQLRGIATYNQKYYRFDFPNGSVIRFGYANTDSDMDNYQGQAFDVIFMDEATHFTEFMYMKFTECLRLSDGIKEYLKKHPGEHFSPRMYLTANPGGVGHTWFKRLFVDKVYREGEDANDYTFIPALVYDNEFLMKENPTYVKQLEALPEKEKLAMLYGDWNVFEGQFFEEFDEEIHTFDPKKFMTDYETGKSMPFYLSTNWRLYRVRDYGLDKTACYWAALTEDGTFYVYRELWESDLSVSVSGDKINFMTPNNEIIYSDICPPDMWNRQSQTGKSAVDILIEKCKQYPTKANNDRETGWLMVKEMLRINPKTGKPYLMISQSCPNLIHSIKFIQHDEKNPNDCAKEPHEITHSADALRYLCTSYTYAPDRVSMHRGNERFEFSNYALNIGEYEGENNDDDDYGMIDMGNLNDLWS